MLEMCFLLASASFFCHQVAPLSFCLDMCSVEYTEVVLISFLALRMTMCARFLSFMRHFYCLRVVFIVWRRFYHPYFFILF